MRTGEGQVVWVIALPEHAPPARAVAEPAYEKGARYVDVDYADQHVRRARIELAEEGSLGWTPPWTLAKVDHLAEEHGALIQIVGDPSQSCSPTSTEPASARRGCASRRALRESDQPAADQLGDPRLPERGLGGVDLR